MKSFMTLGYSLIPECKLAQSFGVNFLKEAGRGGSNHLV